MVTHNLYNCNVWHFRKENKVLVEKLCHSKILAAWKLRAWLHEHAEKLLKTGVDEHEIITSRDSSATFMYTWNSGQHVHLYGVKTSNVKELIMFHTNKNDRRSHTSINGHVARYIGRSRFCHQRHRWYIFRDFQWRNKNIHSLVDCGASRSKITKWLLETS